MCRVSSRESLAARRGGHSCPRAEDQHSSLLRGCGSPGGQGLGGSCRERRPSAGRVPRSLSRALCG